MGKTPFWAVFSLEYFTKPSNSFVMQKQIKLLCIIPDPDDGTSFYRAMGPFGLLRKTIDIDFIVDDRLCRKEWAILECCDAVFFQRPFTERHLEAVTVAKEAGKKVWLDYDDDLLTVPSDNPCFPMYGKMDVQENIVKMVQMADVVSVSTIGLADNWFNRGMKRDYVVINNALNFKGFPFWRPEPHVRSNRIIWRGSTSHMRDVLSVSNEIVDVITNSKDFEFEFIGDRLWYLTDRCPREKVVITGAAPVREYFKYIHAWSPKVMFAPLVNHVFNKAKSNIAWLEATFAGAVCVCPDMPEWQNKGALNYTNGPRFKELFQMALDLSDSDHKRLWQESMDVVSERYDLNKVNKERERIIGGLL